MSALENVKLGDWCVRYLQTLKTYKGKGANQPLRLRTWQQSIIRKLVSHMDPANPESRLYREAFIAMPKKNGKSTLIAALVVLFLCGIPEAGGEIYSAAATRDQASLVFKTVAHMIRADPHLRTVCKVVDSKKTITHTPSGSTYKALSADVNFTDGIDASVVIYDELHRAKNRDLFDLLSNSQGARDQPLFVVITTAGADQTSVCYEQWQRAEKVRDGILDDPRLLPVIYAADKRDDWKSPTTWMKANPALGDFLSMADMERECKKAMESPSALSSFLRLRLNIWTEADDPWLDMARWDRAGAPFDEKRLQGADCFVGLDLGSTSDHSAAAFIFPRPGEDGKTEYWVKMHYWLPGLSIADKEARTGVPYRLWVEQGHMEATGDEITDYDKVRARIKETFGKVYNIKGVAGDPWNASQIMTQLTGDGFNVVQFRQGFQTMSPASKEFERAVIAGKLRHAGHPVLRWNVSNTVVETDAAGNVKPTKKRSKGKIDGVVACIMGLAMAMKNDGGPMRSIYESGPVEPIG